MAQTVPITKSQYLLTISGLDFYFESFSGLEDKANTSDYSDGLSNRLYKLVGARVTNEMTLTKAFDPARDKALIDWFKDYCPGAGLEQTVSITPVKYCPNPEPSGNALVLYGVKPTGVKFAEADKKSNDVSMIQITFVCDDYKYA